MAALTLLHKACREGNLEALQKLVAVGMTAEDLRSRDNLALHRACHNGDLPIVEYLRAQGLTVDDLRSRNNRALQLVCSNGHLSIMEYLITEIIGTGSVSCESVPERLAQALGLSLENLHCLMEQPLYLACSKGYLQIVQYLVTQGIITVEDFRANTYNAFRAICQNNDCHLLEYVVAQGLTVADIRHANDLGFKLAYFNRCQDTMQSLIWAGQYTKAEVADFIRDPELLASLIFEQPEPAREDLVKPASVCKTDKRGPASDCKTDREPAEDQVTSDEE